MKKMLLAFLCLFCFISVIFPVIAQARHYGYSKSPRYSSYGSTHTVKTHFRKGRVILSHRAGNPRSGVHCRNNICTR
jgi:hypothetical protein